MTLPLLFEVIAEGMRRAMGWVCVERPNAVSNTLKQLLRWRSTTWWQSKGKRDERRPLQMAAEVVGVRVLAGIQDLVLGRNLSMKAINQCIAAVIKSR